MENIVIGTPVYQQGAYILDKFITQQQQIQKLHPACELIFATPELNFIPFLTDLIKSSGLRGSVLPYEVIKPHYSRSSIWNIACGREALRKYTLSHTAAEFLCFLDADMLYDPSILEILEREIQGYDVVFSGYPLRNYGLGLSGNGCVMLSRKILGQLTIRCYEYKNREVIFEDNVLEFDLFRAGARVKKGFFVSISHYSSKTEVKHITPRPVGVLRKILNSPLIRYCLISASIFLHYNIPWKLKVVLNTVSVEK